MDKDSLTLCCSRSSRIKLLAQWTLVSVKMKADHDRDSEYDVFSEITSKNLAKGGDVRLCKSDLGCLKIARVRIAYFIYPHSDQSVTDNGVHRNINPWPSQAQEILALIFIARIVGNVDVISLLQSKSTKIGMCYFRRVHMICTAIRLCIQASWLH